MKTILLPTDYSETAKNAALYAFELAKQIGSTKIILYNAYQAPVAVDPSLPVMQLLNMDDIQRISEEGMKNFKNELASHADADIHVETLNEFAVLHSNIDDVCEHTRTDLVVMGITGGGGLEEVLIGSNTINVVKHTKVPVLIVPAEAKYKQVKEIVLVCDYKKIDEAIPQKQLKNILEATKAKLFVLNIDHNKDHANDLQEAFGLDNALKDYAPEYHHVDKKDFAEAVNEFVANNEVDMIITIPKKYGFFESIFKRSHTKQLAYHTHVPLLCMHD
ncbi:MAG TPA: universal stress protein [Segetibacter sp.]|jgi:nucleotide-binding universal stress UspA family protein